MEPFGLCEQVSKKAQQANKNSEQENGPFCSHVCLSLEKGIGIKRKYRSGSCQDLNIPFMTG
jgi:hypothetical protein